MGWGFWTRDREGVPRPRDFLLGGFMRRLQNFFGLIFYRGYRYDGAAIEIPDKSAESFSGCVARRDAGKPVARRGRKATGPASGIWVCFANARRGAAELPMGGGWMNRQLGGQTAAR